jgi:hypothetical protein
MWHDAGDAAAGAAANGRRWRLLVYVVLVVALVAGLWFYNGMR